MKKPMLLLFTSIALITMLSVSAQMPPGGHPGGNTDRNQPPMMGPQNPKYMDRGFSSNSQYMIIEGLIAVEESGIVLSISATPNTSVMGDHHMQMEELPSNTINVTLYKLVEFEDSGTPGFDENDKVVSSYFLNSSTLGDLVYTSNGDSQNYSVSSDDSVFSMTVEANTTGVQSFKWSVELKYPFLSPTSEIAMLHEVVTERSMEMTRDHMMSNSGHMGGHDGTFEAPTHLKNNSLIVRDADIPMFFKWLDVAEVDGQSQLIDANVAPGYFALSIPQGSQIYYDPSIGVENDVIANLDSVIAQIFEAQNSFINSVLSPSSSAIAIAFVSVIIVMLLVNRRKFISRK